MTDLSSSLDSGEKSVVVCDRGHAVEVRVGVEVRVRAWGLCSHSSL